MTPNRPTTGSSDMQQAFEADVRLTAADVGLYLVVAATDDGRGLATALARAGAATAARISPRRVLAVMPFPAFESLRADRAVSLIGPVHLDPARFAMFEQLIGRGEPAPTPT